jgi:hypothetical protein
MAEITPSDPLTAQATSNQGRFEASADMTWPRAILGTSGASVTADPNRLSVARSDFGRAISLLDAILSKTQPHNSCDYSPEVFRKTVVHCIAQARDLLSASAVETSSALPGPAESIRFAIAVIQAVQPERASQKFVELAINDMRSALAIIESMPVEDHRAGV